MVSFSKSIMFLGTLTRQLLLSTGHFDGAAFALGRSVSDHDSVKFDSLPVPLDRSFSISSMAVRRFSLSPSKSLALGPGVLVSRDWPGDQ